MTVTITKYLEIDAACKVLGVTTSDAWADVKKAYSKLARELHPDMHEPGDEESQEKTARFRVVKDAYELLRSEEESAPGGIFGLPEPTQSAYDSWASTPIGRQYANTTDDVPEAEWLRVDSIAVYVKYERRHYGDLMAYLEVNLGDALRLNWYPVPLHVRSIDEVRVVVGGGVVMTHPNYTGDIESFRKAFTRWQDERQRKEASRRLTPRLADLEKRYMRMERYGRPVVRLVDLMVKARRAHADLTSSYRPSTQKAVEKLFSQVEEELNRLKDGGPGVIVDDLLDGVLYHADVEHNNAVIEEVKSWHIRTNGFIDLIDEPVLRAFYERRITSEKVSDLKTFYLRLNIEDYVLEDLVNELDDLAPASIALESSKGVVEYPVRYQYFERDGLRVPLGVVTLPLRVYEHNAPEYGKASKLPTLPHGIELRVEIVIQEKIIFAGSPGEELDKKVTKLKRSRGRGKAIEGVGNDLGLRRYQPIAATPVPPWYTGSRPRW